MPDVLQKGWLTTRDGQKYAPATLVENVYTRSGKPYDERVREYIQGLKSISSTSIAALQTSVQEHDKEIEALQNKTIYFNGNASDKLFIVDSKENVIAYIDGNGVNSVDFNSPTYGVSLSGVKNSITAVNNELASLRAEIETGSNDLNNLNVEDSDRLFIIDSKENVIAYIDGTGIHSINFFVDEKQEGAMDYWTAIRKLAQCIIDLDAVEANVATFENEVDNRLQNFDGNSDGNKLFIVDQKNNVIAYVDGTGVHSIDFSIDDKSGIIYSVKTTIEELLQADIDLESALKNLINIEAEARAAADAGLSSEIDDLGEDIDNLETKTKNLDSDENTDGLFIVDSVGNVIAYIDSLGFHTTNIFIEDYSENGNTVAVDIRNIGTRTVALENWKSNDFVNWQSAINDDLSNYKARLSIQEQVTGETAIPTKTHKERLDDLEAYIGSAGDPDTSLNSRLAAMESLVGTKDDAATIDSHEGRIKSVTNALAAFQSNMDIKNVAQDTSHKALSKAVNYLGEFTSTAPDGNLGDLAIIDNVLKCYNGNTWENFEGLSKKLYYFDGSESGVFYFTDKDDNVIAFVDNNGITTIDIIMKTLKRDSNGFWSVVSGDVSNNVSTSLSQKLVEILNNRIADASDIATLKSEVSNIKLEYKPKQTTLDSGAAETNEFVSRIEQNANGVITVTKSSVDLNNYYTKSQMDAALTPIQEKLIDVSNVMDFKGAYPELPTITIGDEDLFQNGDVIVVTSGVDKGKEFVCYNKIWIEFGNSDATSIAIANLQSVVGHSGALPSGESSHHVQLESHNARIENLEEAVEDVEADVANLQDWQENWDVKAGNNVEDKIYFIDSKDNVIAYLDNDGLTVTNINLRTPNVPSGEMANAVGQSTNHMIFFKSRGTITVDDSIL